MTFPDERHNCARSGCQHAAIYSDERYCYYHEPPVSEHDCYRDNCSHWKTGEQRVPVQPVKAEPKPVTVPAIFNEEIELGDADF